MSEQDKAMGRLPYMTWFFRTSTAEAGDENVSPRKLICSSRFDLKLAIPHGSGENAEWIAARVRTTDNKHCLV